MRKNTNLKIRFTMGQPMVHYLSNGDFCTFSFHCIFFFLNENAQLLYFVTFYFILFFLSFIWSTLGSNCSLCTLSYKRAHPFKSGTSLPSSEPLASLDRSASSTSSQLEPAQVKRVRPTLAEVISYITRQVWNTVSIRVPEQSRNTRKHSYSYSSV